MEFTNDELEIIFNWYRVAEDEGMNNLNGDALAERIKKYLESQDIYFTRKWFIVRKR